MSSKCDEIDDDDDSQDDNEEEEDDDLLPPPVATNSLTAHVEALTATVAQLSTENETLKRNMGILFRTARAEIERKDHEIHLLQAELDESHKRARPEEQGKRNMT
ncbi:hypothetical protein MPSEU_001026300 [Mayamaea pseudoterrestris]|nr:hypothetical protein MPSEU_001026300 [Mayamaea pseudoterrestris]